MPKLKQTRNTANWRYLQMTQQLLYKTNTYTFKKRSTKLPWRTILVVLKMKTYPKSPQSETKIFTLWKYKNPTVVQFNNQEIQWNGKDDSMTYLGIHLDKKLSWKIHINKKLNRGYILMKILYALLMHGLTVQMKCSLLLYTAILRPPLTNTCPVWAAASQTKN